MADVRLTATNPEDSSVVPVACDAAGRLLLEEPQVIEGPPGPPGEQGPPGQNGDPFSGNFADDVTFGGNAEFAGVVQAANAPNGTRTEISPQGQVYVVTNSGGSSDVVWQHKYGSSTPSTIKADGSAEFVGDVEVGDNIKLYSNGSCSFAGNKAGFTAEGYLWCTTRRGDTVILDATSNGLASWVEYTPTSRIDEIRDKLDANRGDTGEMPADTP